jgi:hypothetical protein
MILDPKVSKALDIIETVIKTIKNAPEEPNTDEEKEEMLAEFVKLGTVLVIQKAKNI